MTLKLCLLKIALDTFKKTYADTLKKSTDVILKSNISISNKLKNVSLVSEKNALAVVIEHIEPPNSKINYINSLFSYIECDIKIISKVNFNGKNSTILFTLPCAKALFLQNKDNIHNSIYNYLFIRTYLNIESVRRVRVLYHATKSNLIKNAKTVFNKTSKYEQNFIRIQHL